MFAILAAIRKEFPGVYTSSNVFCNVRSTCDAMENFEAFWLFFDRLVANIAGKKAWRNRDKVGEAITTGGRITIVDEAFTILALQNYWPKWFSTTGVPGRATWTDSRQGNAQYMGWEDAAYTRFDTICHRIQAQRETTHSKNLEQTFQEKATLEYATLRGGTRARNRHTEPSRKVFNELACGHREAV